MKKALLGVGAFAVATTFAAGLNVVSAFATDISSDYSITGNETEGLVVKSGSSVTISIDHDLALDGDIIFVENGATATIKGTGTLSAKTNSVLFNNGTTKIESGTLANGGTSFYTVLNHGNLTINGGKILGSQNIILKGSSFEGPSNIENGYYDFGSTNPRVGYVVGTGIEKPTLTINGGTFEYGMYNVKNDDNGVLTINKGTFENSVGFNVQNWNKATINGGTFHADVAKKYNNAKESVNVYDGYMNTTTDTGELTINGGAFDSEYSFMVKGAPEIAIANGNFNSTKALATSIITPTVTGGTFADKKVTVDEEKYAKIGNTDGSVTVKPIATKISANDMNITTGTNNNVVVIKTTPDNAYYGTVTYSSSDEKVATVDENGVVTAVSAGTATITIVTENELTTTLTVTVKDAPIANPNTLDNVVVYGAIMMIALAGLASSAILIKKNAK